MADNNTSGRLLYTVDFEANQSQLKSLREELRNIINMSTADFQKIHPELDMNDARKQLSEVRASAQQVQQTLSNAFNVHLGEFNISKIQNELKSLDGSIGTIYENFRKIGPAGVQAFNQIPSAIMKTNLQLKESHSLLDKLGTTFTNSIKWGVTSRVVNGIADSIQGAWNYTRQLDTSLNDIRIVSGKSADEMERFAVTANKAAQNLGRSTKDYTDAALIYYQQGLDDEESQARAETTLKAANVTGQSGRAVSEQLTAVWNGYNIKGMADTEAAVDKLAAVAATTAADLEELSTGMSKVASAANIMGVDIDQLNAQIATIVSVTRQAPESVGTALKTIYARMGDIKAGLDSEVSLGNYTSKMKAMGVDVLDASGNLRDMGEVIEEVGGKWNTMTREQQVSLSQIMAGTRQYNNLLSLFDNWDMYEGALSTSKNSLGELQREQDIYMESTKAHLESLNAAWERVFDAFVDNKGVNGIIDFFSSLVNGLGNFTEAIGGGGNAILTFGGIITKVFNKQISQSISATVNNFKALDNNLAQIQGKIESLQGIQDGLSIKGIQEDPGTKERLEYLNKINDKNTLKNFSIEQIEQYIDLTDQLGEIVNEQEAYNVKVQEAENYIKRLVLAYGELKEKEEDKEKKAEQLAKEFSETGNVSDEVAKAQSNFQDASIAIEQYSDNVNDLKNNIIQYRKEQIELDKLQERQNKIKVNPNATNTQVDLIGKQIEAQKKVVDSASRNIGESLKNVKNNFEKIGKSDLISDKTKKSIKEATDSINGISIGVGKNFNKLTEENLQKVEQNMNKIPKIAKGVIDNTVEFYKQGADKVDDIVSDTMNRVPAEQEGSANTIRDKLNGMLTEGDTQALVSRFVSISSAAMNLSSGLLALANIDDIFNNEEIDTGEKFLQVIMALGMGIPQTLTGLMDLKNGLSGLGKVVTDYIGKVKNTITIEAAEALQMRMKNELIKAGRTEQIAGAVAERGASIAVETHSKALTKEIALLIAKKTAMVGLVALGITAVVAGTYALVKAYNSTADASKQAEENAKDLSNAYQQSKQQYDTLVQSIDKYNELQTGLDTLTRGTEEWNNALRESNAQVLELLNNYPELAKSVIKADDGRLMFSKEGLENLLTKQAQSVATMGAISNDAQAESREKSADYDATVMYRELNNDAFWSELGGTITTTFESALAGFVAGGPLGAVVGAGVGLGVGINDQHNSGTMLNAEEGSELMEKAATLFSMRPELFSTTTDENGQTVAARYEELSHQLGVSNEKLINAIVNNVDQMATLSASLDSNTEAQHVEAQQSAHEYLSNLNNDQYNKYSDKDIIDKMMGLKLEDTDSKEYQDMQKNVEKMNNKELGTEYAQISGLNVANGNQFKEKDGKIEIVLKDGTTTSVTKEAMQQAVTYSEWLNKAGGDLEQYIEKANKLMQIAEVLSTNGDDSGKEALSTFVGGEQGNFEALSQKQVDAIKNNTTNTRGQILDNFSSLGFESKEAFDQALTQATLDYSAEAAEIANGMQQPVLDAFNSLDLSNASLTAKKSISDMLNTVYEDQGTEGMNKAKDAMVNIAKESGQSLDELSDIFNNIDWSQDAMTQVGQAMADQGMKVDTTTESWKQLKQVIEEIAKIKNITNPVETFRKKLADVNDIIEKVSKDSKTISDEEFEDLTEKNGAVASYFTKTLDGYKFTGKTKDRDKLADLLGVGEEDLLEARNGLDEKRKLAEEYANSPQMKEIRGINDTNIADENNLNKIQTSLDNTNENVFKFLGIGGSKEQYDEAINFVRDKQNEINSIKEQSKQEGFTLSEDQKNLQTEYEKNIDLIEKYKNSLIGLNTEYKNGELSVQDFESMVANSATSIEDLQELQDKGIVKDRQVIDDAYINLDKDNDYEGLDGEELENYADYLQRAADNSDMLSNSLKDNDEAAEVVAKGIMKMNDAIDTLADNWDQWGAVLKGNTDVMSEEYAEAMEGTIGAVADLLDVSDEYISDDFVRAHLEEIGQAATGSETAIDGLKAALSEQIIADIIVDNQLTPEKVNSVQTDIQKLKDLGSQIEVGMQLTGEDEFVKVANNIVQTAGLTASQANALFDSMGFETEFEVQQKPVKKTGHGTRTVVEMKDEMPVTMPDGTQMTVPAGWETKTYPGEAYDYVDYVDVPAMATNGKAPVINSITKKAPASANNYSSTNKGGKSPGKSSNKNKGSGNKGKGGSSKQAKKPDKMDKVDDEADRYHQVDTQLSKIEKSLKGIESQEKKLTGEKLIKNLNAQLDQLNNRIDRLREKVGIAQGEAAELQSKLAGKGVQFNADGTISNYMQAFQAQLNYVNSVIDRYNSMSAEEQEGYKDTVEQAKKDFDKFKKDLDNYDKLVSDTIPGLQNDIQDAIDEEIEINIKKFNIEFEAELDIKDAMEDWNEFKKKVLDDIDDDDIFGNARARAIDDMSVYLDENGGGMLAAATKQTETLLDQLRQMDETGWASVYGDDRASALEDLQEAYQEIEKDLIEMKEIQDDLREAWLDTMDEISDKMGDQVDLYEQLGDIIDHDMKVVELVYGETDYESLAKYYEKMHENNLGLLDFQRQSADFWRQQMDSIVDKNSEQWKAAKENWLDAINDLNDTIEDSIENARDKMENAIDAAFKKYNDSVTNAKGLDYTEQQWDLINDNEDDYLDDVNAAFGIRDLERKYKDAIDQTDNVKAQRQLNDLMEDELKKLREKDKLSEYDVERAKMRYEIELKRIALEEAQQTKDTMRLRRDSQGNYRYEYVADEDEIGKLQGELDELENSLYNFDKDRWLEMQGQLIDAMNERQEAIKEILMDASLTEEERMERLAEINELYNEKIQNITDLTVDAQNNLYESGAEELGKIWDQEGKDFDELNEEMQRKMVEEMLPQFQSGVNEMIEAFAGPDGFRDTTVECMEELGDATQDYVDDLHDVEDAAAETFDEVEWGIDKNIPMTEELIGENEDLLYEYQQQIDAIRDLNNLLDQHILKYTQISQAAKAAAQEAYNYWNTQKQIEAEQAAREAARNGVTGNAAAGNAGSGGGSGGGGAGAGANADKAEGVAAAIWVMGGAASGWYNGGDRFSRLREKFGSESVVQSIINSQGPSGQLTKKWNGRRGELGNYYYGRFNTGGYTGDWVGDYGKMAILDKKELVLNAGDTENMLNMIKIAKDVVNASGIRAELLNKDYGYKGVKQTEQLEQDVHIEANFPNVQSAAEIEEALNNLVNLAAQRASRNTRG